MKLRRMLCIIFSALIILTMISCSSENIKTENKNNLNDAEPVEPDEGVDTQSIEETKAVADTALDAELGRLSGLKICVDPGHGTFTESYKEPVAPGSSEMKAAFVTGTSGDYQTEAEFNLKVALLLKDMLEAEGAAVFMTRTGPEAELSNIGRAQLGNDNNCDVAVRIHADGSENTAIHGISMLVPGSGGYITDQELIETSREIGEYVLDAVIGKTGDANRGIVNRTDLTGFNWSTIPSILIECGFMSNPLDDEKLSKPEYQQLLAEGILEGLINYFNS